MEELLKSLIFIQQHLNAPKDKFNSFGKYKYRSLEGILASLKPLLANQSCGIRFESEIEDHCGRTFVKTTLYFFNDKGQSVSTSAVAEHSAIKSGMDASQISGAASSYAKKYALNGLFAIDDSNDADTDEFHNQTANSSKRTSAAPRRTNTAFLSQQHSGYTPQDMDPLAGIKNAINSAENVADLMSLYLDHQGEIEANIQIKNLLTQRKLQLQNAA